MLGGEIIDKDYKGDRVDMEHGYWMVLPIPVLIMQDVGTVDEPEAASHSGSDISVYPPGYYPGRAADIAKIDYAENSGYPLEVKTKQLLPMSAAKTWEIGKGVLCAVVCMKPMKIVRSQTVAVCNGCKNPDFVHLCSCGGEMTAWQDAAWKISGVPRDTTDF